MEYDKEKTLFGINNQKPINEIKPVNVEEKKHQPPHKIFEGYVKVNVNTKKSKSKS
jgi:hypothetical protein